MPKELSHWFLAAKLRQSGFLSKECARTRLLLDRFANLYQIGAVSPDTIYYQSRGAAKLLKKRLFYSHGRHNADIYGFLPRLIETAADQTEKKAALAFGLGCLAHLWADEVFHPFVEYFAGGPGDKPVDTLLTDALSRHYRLESAIDTIFATRYLAGQRLCLDYYFKNIEIATRRLAVLAAVVFLPPEEIGSLSWKSIAALYRRHRRLQRLFYHAWLKKPLKLVLSGLGHPELAELFYCRSDKNLAASVTDKISWRNPVTGESRLSSLADLTDRFIDQAGSRLKQIESFLASGAIKHAEAPRALSELMADWPRLDPDSGLPVDESKTSRFFDPQPPQRLFGR